MKSSDLKKLLNTDNEVIVHVEGECYYPIKEIKHVSDKTFIVCKNIKKVKE